MSEGLQQYREAKRVLDIIFNSPFSSRQWPGYLSVEQIMERLGLHRRSVYKLIHTHLVPRGGAVRGRAGRLLVTQEAFEEYVKEHERRPRRNKLVTFTRWTRIGPLPVPPRPRRVVVPRLRRTSPYVTYLWERMSPEDRNAIIAKVSAEISPEQRLTAQSRHRGTDQEAGE